MTLASYIDHTILRPDCQVADIRTLCEEAVRYQFAAVCIPPFYVKDACHFLEPHSPKVATVIGFPMGYAATSAKVEEIKRAFDEGADEVDAVINLCAVKNENWNFVRNDIDSMTTAAHLKGKHIKIILETGLLTEDEIRRLCTICREIGPEFVKTSTGFNGQGASVAAVQLMHQMLKGSSVKIKASGGIRTRQDAQAMIDAGAQRIGSSSGVRIASEE